MPILKTTSHKSTTVRASVFIGALKWFLLFLFCISESVPDRYFSVFSIGVKISVAAMVLNAIKR